MSCPANKREDADCQILYEDDDLVASTCGPGTFCIISVRSNDVSDKDRLNAILGLR